MSLNLFVMLLSVQRVQQISQILETTDQVFKHINPWEAFRIQTTRQGRPKYTKIKIQKKSRVQTQRSPQGLSISKTSWLSISFFCQLYLISWNSSIHRLRFRRSGALRQPEWHTGFLGNTQQLQRPLSRTGSWACRWQMEAKLCHHFLSWPFCDNFISVKYVSWSWLRHEQII